MVRIDPIVARRGIGGAPEPNIQIDQSIAEGLGNVGNAVGQVARAEQEADLQAIAQRNEIARFEAEQGLQRLEDDNALLFAQAQQEMPASGEGFVQTFEEALSPRYDEFVDTVPEAYQKLFAEYALTKRNAWLNKALVAETNARNAWYVTGIESRIEKGRQTLINDPSQFDAVRQDVVRLIEASGMTAAEKQAATESAAALLGGAVADNQLRDDPAALAGQLGIPESRDSYYAAVEMAESGGNPNAQSSTSSAMGLFGFTKGTWNGLVERYPGAGLTREGRSDPEQQRVAIRLLTAENASALQDAGIADTNGNLYAAHFLGAAGAKKVLSAPNGASMASVVDPEVITANPFLKGMTVGGFKAWAARKGGGNAPGYEGQPAPEYAGIALGDRLKLYDQAMATMAQQEAASAALAANAVAQTRDQTALGITLGTVVSEQQILELGLPDSETNTLIKQLRSEIGAVDEAQQWLQQWAAGTAPSVNPYNEADRALLGKAYDVLARTTPKEQMPELAAQFAESTGIVPKAAVADVRQGLNATAVADVASAMEQAANLYDVAPRGLDAVEHGKELRDAALMYQELVNGQGLPVTVAAQRLIDSRDPAKVQAATVLDARWKVESKNLGINDVLGAFGDNFLPGGPNAGLLPLQQDALLADYMNAAERAFNGPANGDMAIARMMALDEIKKSYGVSRVSGSDALTKFPPENFFPPRSGGHGYLRDMVLRDARTLLPGATNVMLIAGSETAQDVRAGTPPRYNLLYQRPDGAWDMAPELWTVDPGELQELAAIDTERRRLQFEIARETNLNVQPGRPSPLALPAPFASSAAPTRIDENRARLVDLDQQQQQLLGTAPSIDTSSAPDLSALYQQQLESNPMFGGVVQ